jgi:hypothetical protein
VGTGTSFTTELSVGQIVKIPGTATEYGVVASITDNTHFAFYAVMANTASGQTATRVSGGISIPAGLAGYYDMGGMMQCDTARSTYGAFRKNPTVRAGGTLITVFSDVTDTNLAKWLNGHTLGYHLVEGDFVVFAALTATGNNAVANGTRLPSLTLRLMGV